MTKIALFGTSADPPTTGHQAIIKWLSKNFEKVVIWASDNPLKNHQTFLEKRSKMLSILIENIDYNQNNIYLHQELSSCRTLETVELAIKKWNDGKFTLVVGSDLVKQLLSWYHIEELLQKVELLIIPRQGITTEEEDLQKLRELSTEVKIAFLEVPNVSSSAYREQGDEMTITPPIKDYIYRHKLYQWQKTSTEKL
ncbi:MAG: nicotinate-nucleotide adenylyltransferase [Trichodesmium sp. St16_bin4-tuft]|nr:nicotinate-nucleotide adenylyltransferase [Trichodesmium sp. MAG_R01]MDE5072592.1 nicotinate-nucleotide adenylyltransferase [Trichodesmium sp. St5_bin8]MDE5077926.1 nicotinate-nucleotide adenylyltransferase [Trichodesmium sp. St2_bin6]MDE5090294.1 nicotinate-nucleotide adenylyltransferase [Trichodesmium sp. St18_bin3_1_1]MDE5101383.1 nicotinate-nucleotide adenylyltransferase [Trichodesmium sp. St16_bin4-tuft]MDE5102158.1 nicotinate-nucleotide adenylyltransferase [Trichodesmium sp. St19_bin2